ncbi:lipopolysaccharide biosynthesis protein [Haliscomenobacter hydrossis]|uniref:Uncharacterized protein n=1 Tax=Haliscomenobacter hydrossis (strain ATCC 27775 / DSM 1100 / LMG 10767 / O) TaxID=760192 RepID=F4L7H2_HALH1|nr:polysaccharide biosynthesis C-terminal domain-containing protein [Haliscomenobacter hydrossis]AEE54152.1 hypothetical protein Halhy_6333 [Haliscomenobacter hydrossis DSM 1100]
MKLSIPKFISHLSSFISLQRAYLSFQLLRQGTMLLIAILLAKSSLGAAAIGQYEQVWFLGGALSYFWANGLQQGLVSFFPRLAPAAQARLFASAVGLYFFISAVLIGALVFFPAFFLPLFSGQSSIPFAGISFLFLFFYLPSLLTETLYLLQKKATELLLYGIFSFSLQLAVVLLPAFWGWGVQSIIQGLLGLSMLRALWMLVLALRYGHLAWDWPQLKTWWNASFYLVVYAAIGGSISVFNAWIVNWYYLGDERQFALFRYGARELPVSLALVSGLNALFLQKVAEDVHLAMPEIYRRSTRLMHFLMPFTIVLMLTSKWWFVLLFSTEFVESLPVFNTFLLLVISRVVFSFPILNGLQDKRIAIVGACSEALFNVVLCLLLVPIWGLLGTALANFLAYGLEKFIYGVHLLRRYGIAPGTYLNVPVWGIYALVLILVWALQIVWA